MSEGKEVVKKDEMKEELALTVPTATPVVDIYENDDEIVLYADMPGVKKEDITVNIDNGRLEIVGMRKIEAKGAVNWEEFGDLEYRRTFSIPQATDLEKVNAELKNGSLCLHLPKSAAAKARRIKIKNAA